MAPVAAPAALFRRKTMTLGDELQILLVEDDDDHAEIVSRGLVNNRVLNHIHRVPDGEAALDYVFRRGVYADPDLSPRPNVILLDLRLPRVDGLEVLRTIKESEETRSIPVVVLTTSDAERDVTSAYDRHANSYLVKPVEFDKFTQMMQTLGFYWLAWNREPVDEPQK
jgi:two-component system response regulator